MDLPFASRRRLSQAFDFALDVASSRDAADLQRRFVRGGAPLVDADIHGIYLFEDGVPSLVTSTAAPTGFLREYESSGRAADPLLAHLHDSREPVHDRLLFSARDWRREPLRQIMHSWGLEHSLQGPLRVGNRLIGTINFARMTGTRAFGVADLRTAGWLCQQVNDAYRRVAAQELLDLRGACFDVINAPVLVTNARGRVVVANRAARPHLQPFDPSQLKPSLAAAVAANVASLERDPVRLAEADSLPGDVGEVTVRVRTRKLRGPADYYASTFMPALEPGERPTSADVLSPREQQVACLVAAGLTNEEIASRLVISPNTTKDHLKRIHRKLGVSRRTQVALWAERHLGG
ncbi:MAG: LuxR C-terminal-related transcriptional regulator [Solirubrobacterales bacterium]